MNKKDSPDLMTMVGVGVGVKLWDRLGVALGPKVGWSWTQRYWEVQYASLSVQYDIKISSSPPPLPPPAPIVVPVKPPEPVQPKPVQPEPIKIAPPPPVPPTPEQLLAKAADFEKIENWESAVKTYESCQQQYGKTAEIYKRFSGVYEKQGQFQKAFEMEAAVIKEFPDQADFARHVQFFLQISLAQDAEEGPYISDQHFVEFQEQVMVPLATAGNVDKLGAGVDAFFAHGIPVKEGVSLAETIKDKNLYALFVFNEFLKLGLSQTKELPLTRDVFDARIAPVFYGHMEDGGRILRPASRIGANLYLQLVLTNNRPVLSEPDAPLLKYFYDIGCRRSWIDAIIQRREGKPQG
jgi:hypothetical protein